MEENLEEELKKSADRMKEYKENGMYDKESAEHIIFSEIVDKINTKNHLYDEADLIDEVDKEKIELKESADRMQQFKDNGLYEQEAMEHSNYSEIVSKLSEKESKLQKIQSERNGKVEELNNELKKSADRMKMYKENGLYGQETEEHARYNEIISQISDAKVIMRRPTETKQEEIVSNDDTDIENTEEITEENNIEDSEKVMTNEKKEKTLKNKKNHQNKNTDKSIDADNKNNKIAVIGVGMWGHIKAFFIKVASLFKAFKKNNIEAEADFEDEIDDDEYEDLSEKIENETQKVLKNKEKDKKNELQYLKVDDQVKEHLDNVAKAKAEFDKNNVKKPEPPDEVDR